MLVMLRITPEADGSWRLLCGRPDEAPHEGRLSAAEVAQLRARASAMLGGEADGLGHAERTRAEERLGQAIAADLDHALGGLFQRALTDAPMAEGPVRLAIDAGDPTIAAIPWELIADSPESDSIERRDQGAILRLSPTRFRYAPPRSVSSGLRQLRWCPTPTDLACSLRLAELDALARRLSPLRVIDLSPDLRDAPTAEEGWSDVLHLILLGRRIRAQLELLTDELGRRDGAQAENSLLSRARLVVVDVCQAEEVPPEMMAQLGAWLVNSGATACVTPRTPLGPSGARSFSGALYEALTAGAGPLDAVVHARRRVRAIQGGGLDTRWHNAVLTLSSTRALEQPPLVHGSVWLPEGFPTPSSEASALLRRARELSNDQGFVGLEHLILATEGLPVLGIFGDRIRTFGAVAGRALRERLDSLKMRFPRMESDWSGTPRLRGWAGQLRPGFTSENLWEVVLSDPEHLLHLMDPSLALFENRAYHVPDGWGTDEPRALGVLGGPEDGRRVSLEAPGTLARWNQFGEQLANEVLYDHSARYDASFSRTPVLRWEAGGPIQLVSAREVGLVRWKLPAWRNEDDITDYGDGTPLVERVNPGPIPDLRCGDVLVLSPLTRLRALS